MGIYTWASLLLLVALICAYCFGQALTNGTFATAVLLFIDWLAATLVLVFLCGMERREVTP